MQVAQVVVAPLTTHGCPAHQRLGLHWAPCTNRTEWATWGGSSALFAQLFLFWAMWAPYEDAQVRSCTWTEALLLYISLAKDDAFTFGGSSLPQAVYLFKTLSYKLWARAGLQRFPEKPNIRWHVDMPPDTAICGIIPPGNPDSELVDTLALLQADATATPGVSRSYIHVKCFDLQCQGSSQLHLCHDFFRDITRKSPTKSRALPWWTFKYHVSSLLHPAMTNPVLIQPGQGLQQFPHDHTDKISPADAIHALGHSYMSTLAGRIRRWALAISSFTHDNSCHTVVPSWTSQDWTCMGCNRVANLTRDPQWVHKSCPSPFTSLIDISSFRDTHAALIRLEARIRFHKFPFPLSPLGLPVMNDILDALEAQHKNFTLCSCASLLGIDPGHAGLRTKLKEANLRWKLILSNWQQKGHLFLPPSILANDGYCLGCSVRPKHLQSFLRRPCEHSLITPAHSRARTLILSCQQSVASLHLSGGGFSLALARCFLLSFYLHAQDALFSPLYLIGPQGLSFFRMGLS